MQEGSEPSQMHLSGLLASNRSSISKSTVIYCVSIGFLSNACRSPTSKSSMQAEMPKAASLLQESFRVLSKVPNGRATEAGTAMPSDTCMQ